MTGCLIGTLFGSVKFDWNPEKNEWLKRERGISFEDIALLLTGGHIWKVMKHPKAEKYPNQSVFLVPIDEYIFFVPYVMDGEIIFLKTAIPNRKATKDYLKELEE